MDNINIFANQDLAKIELMIEDCEIKAQNAPTRAHRNEYKELVTDLHSLYIERQEDPLETRYFKD